MHSIHEMAITQLSKNRGENRDLWCQMSQNIFKIGSFLRSHERPIIHYAHAQNCMRRLFAYTYLAY